MGERRTRIHKKRKKKSLSIIWIHTNFVCVISFPLWLHAPAVFLSLNWTSSFLSRSSYTYLPVSGALSRTPYSLAPLFYCPTPLPSSFPPQSLVFVGRWESRRTCLFINVSEGSRRRRGERATSDGAQSEKMCQNEKGSKCKRDGPLRCGGKLMKRQVKRPQAPGIKRQRAASQRNLIFFFCLIHFYFLSHWTSVKVPLKA